MSYVIFIISQSVRLLSLNQEPCLLDAVPRHLGRSVEPGSNMAASTTAIRDRGISVTTWEARHHGNTAAADDSCAGPK